MISPRISGRLNFGQVSAESSRRTNELEEMRQRLEAKKLMVDNTSVACKVTEQDVKKKEDDLSAEVRSLLVGGTTLSIAKTKLQVLSFIGRQMYILDYGVWLFQISPHLWLFVCVSICVFQLKYSSFNCLVVLL